MIPESQVSAAGREWAQALCQATLPRLSRCCSIRLSSPGSGCRSIARIYAVHIIRVPKESWTGYGVYLGNGVVVTAAHVAGSSLFHKVRVEIAGRDLPRCPKGRPISRRGLDGPFCGRAAASGQPATSPNEGCKDPPSPGEEVIVAIPEGIARSHVISPSVLPVT